MGFLEPSVFEKVAEYLFPQLVPQRVNRIIDLEINRKNFSVTCEQGRIFKLFLSKDYSRSGLIYFLLFFFSEFQLSVADVSKKYLTFLTEIKNVPKECNNEN